MKFDRTKIKTIATAHEVEVGDYGWFNTHSSHMERYVQKTASIKRVRKVDLVDDFPFYYSEVDSSEYFYPAPYELAQKAWVKEVGLKVGDKVRIVKGWEKGEGGFNASGGWATAGEKAYVVGWIDKDLIESVSGVGLPYFAIEKVKEEYRPFANAKEFEPYRDEWFEYNGDDKAGTDVFRFDYYCERGVLNYFNGLIAWEELLSGCIFADTGEPAGVRV